MKDALLYSGILFLCVSMVRTQTTDLCPANTQMGLCEAVPKPCFDNTDCYQGEICCPQSCSRTCKPMSPTQTQAGSEIPDLLHHPRVYVGKCPDSNCFSLFGGEPNQCDTSNLCPPEQFCCNNGCNNECRWKPEYAAIIAEQEARARYQQQVLAQKQQQEEMRRQQEAYLQQQRQQAAAAKARQQAQARAAAEAELAAEQDRAQYAADLKAAAQMQAKAAAAAAEAQRQQMAQAAAAAAAAAAAQQPTPLQPSQPPTAPSGPSAPPSSSSGTVNPPSFLDNFLGAPQSAVDTTSNNNSPSSSNNNIYNDNSMMQISYQQPSSSSSSSSSSSGKGTSAFNTQGYFSASKGDNLAGTLSNQINSPANTNPYSLPSQQNLLDKLGALISPPPSTSTYIPQTQGRLGGSPPAPRLPPFPTFGNQSPTSLTSQQGQQRAANPPQRQDPMQPFFMYHMFQTMA